MYGCAVIAGVKVRRGCDLADVFSAKKRSEIMRAVKNKDTAPEIAVRKSLHLLGFRFRLHRADLPGKPDIYLPKYRTAIFVHGCFWHGHNGCSRAKLPKSRKKFWIEKIEKNRKRDMNVIRLSRRRGIRPVVVWSCETRDPDKLRRRLQRLFAKRGADGCQENSGNHAGAQ